MIITAGTPDTVRLGDFQPQKDARNSGKNGGTNFFGGSDLFGGLRGGGKMPTLLNGLGWR